VTSLSIAIIATLLLVCYPQQPTTSLPAAENATKQNRGAVRMMALVANMAGWPFNDGSVPVLSSIVCPSPVLLTVYYKERVLLTVYYKERDRSIDKLTRRSTGFV
jgi:hypothetical protein